MLDDVMDDQVFLNISERSHEFTPTFLPIYTSCFGTAKVKVGVH